MNLILASLHKGMDLMTSAISTRKNILDQEKIIEVTESGVSESTRKPREICRRTLGVYILILEDQVTIIDNQYLKDVSYM
jgi:hypothetical protein